MDRAEIYEKMAARKSAPKDFGTYVGDNGRVNRCIQLMEQGKVLRGGQLLDVGGGIGDLCYAAKQRGLFERATLIDISSKNSEAARSKGVSTVVSDVDRDGFCVELDVAYDLVTALDFIEHIVDPENFARECFRVLRSGGQVFINTPNIQFWRHIETLIGGRMPHTSGDREVYHGGHLAFFTYDDLCEIFSSAGFGGFEQVHDEEGWTSPPQWVWQMAKPKSQQDFVRLSERFGNPNLLFKAVKP